MSTSASTSENNNHTWQNKNGLYNLVKGFRLTDKQGRLNLGVEKGNNFCQKTLFNELKQNTFWKNSLKP